jgi:hypothetical protein
VGGPSTAETWAAARAGVAARAEHLAAGVVEASGVGSDDEVPAESGIEGDTLVVAPPCRWCDFAGLCGRAFGPGGSE